MSTNATFFTNTTLITNSSSRLFPTTAKPNVTTGNDIVKDSFDFKNNPGLVFVLVACLFTGVWLIFLTFYNSRLFASIVTRLLRRFYLKDGYLEIGSLSFSILTGKLMFRDVKYVTKNYSVHIVDGLAIFRWWYSYRVPAVDYFKEVLRDKEKLENGKCRLDIHLNGLEFHLFNRYDLYQRIEEILKCERYGDARKSVQSLDILTDADKKQEASSNTTYNVWRELFPVIRLNICSGKLAIGNRLLENTFWIHFNHANATYSMPDAPCSLDYFSHFIHSKCIDVRMLLSKSPGYKDKTSDPPRWRNQDYTVLHTGEAKVTYFMDVPGLVPIENDSNPEPDPQWGLEVMFTKRAEINYGPWVDLQRDSLQKYFLPNDFQEQPVTKPLEAEQQRLHTGFDVNIEFQEGASIEMLFTRNEDPVAIHFVCGDQNKGSGEKPKKSVIHFHQPWMVNEYGYTTNLFVQLQEVEATTSLKFHKFLESETIEIEVNMAIPRMWNHFQHWTCELCFVKTTCYFVWEHVDYMTDLINEWSVSAHPDIASFVPYEWEFNFYFRDFEIVFLANQFNWVDCTNEDENSELALCGESLDINFLLPFTHFQQEESELKFFFCGETLVLRSFVPESNTLRKSIISLAKNSDRHMYPKTSARQPSESAEYDQPDGLDMYDEVDNGVNLEDQLSKGWRRRTGGTTAWIDVWSVPVIILNLFYKYHVIVPEDDVTKTINEHCGIENKAKEPLDLSPDRFTIELEAGPSAIRIFGHFWRQFFLGFKDNYFGLFQDLNEFNTNREIVLSNTSSSFSNIRGTEVPKDMRFYRPLEVNLTIVLLDLQAELTTHTQADVSSPIAYADRLTFEMHKTYQETRLQLIVSPVTVIVNDQLKRSTDSGHLSRGFLTLTGLQFRGHAMFSDKDIPLGNDTIEYAWLVEVQLGQLKGKMTPSQVQMLASWADTFVLHITDEENKLMNPDPVDKCLHGVYQEDCEKSTATAKKCDDGGGGGGQLLLCPTEDSVKYKMVRVSLESLNFFLVEAETACNIQASPIRFASCNSKTDKTNDGGSLFINEVFLRQFIQQLNMNYVETVAKPSYAPAHSNNWVEVGVIGLGPVTVDIQECLGEKILSDQQIRFLSYHDRRTKRLWFVWSVEELSGKLAVDRCKSRICGCVGGCNFFGKNANGVRFFTNQQLDASSASGSGSHNRYGSESLWGGGANSDIGSNVKQHLLRRSSYFSTSASIVGSASKLSASQQQSRGTSLSGKTFGGSGVDSVSRGRSMSYIGQIRRDSVRGSRGGDTESKLGFGRSRSMVDTTDSVQLPEAMTSADSESTFYSCNSEQEMEEGKSRRGGSRKTASRTSLKSNASTSSYVSAVSSSADLLEEGYGGGGGDFEDGTTGLESLLSLPLIEPALLAAYGSCMQPVKCSNWRQSIPKGFRKKFSLLKNLKAIVPPGHRTSPPSLPNFNPSLHGKIPFSIQNTADAGSSYQKEEGKEEEVEEETYSHSLHSNGMVRSDDRKSVITMKFHQQVTVVFTPLLMNAANKFTTSLTPLPQTQHPCHLLDAIHNRCIEKSKQKFKEKTLFEIITYQSGEQMVKELDSNTSNQKIAVDVLLPQLKLLFFQISGERYTPSEQSSLSAKCGSEYSYNFDARNSDSSLLAAVVTDLKLKAFVKSGDPAMFQCASRICQKFNNSEDYANSRQQQNNFHLLSNDVVDSLKKRDVSDYTIFSGDLQSLKMQLLHLEGPSDKESKLTSIPREKSRASFIVQKGGNLYADGVSLIETSPPSGEEDELGEIIFEAGMDRITLSGSLRSELNQDFFDQKPPPLQTPPTSQSQDELGSNNGNSKPQHRSNSVRRNSKKDPAPAPSLSKATLDSDEADNVFGCETDGKSNSIPMRILNHKQTTPYEPLGSNSTVSSATGYTAHKAISTRKGYAALDIDPGEAADISDVEDEHVDEETPSSLFSGSDYTQGGSRRTSSVNTNRDTVSGNAEHEQRTNKGSEASHSVLLHTNKNSIIKKTGTGGVNVGKVWINLAAPRHLQSYQSDTEQDVNLVMVLVPAASCWIPSTVECIKAVESMVAQRRHWHYSVLSALMGQGLPESGKPLKKIHISGASTKLSRFLQEEFSSQLINALRRQTVGHRFHNLAHALENEGTFPPVAILEKGIYALARQWKTVIAGAEGVQNIFVSTHPRAKKPVVGRGNLPAKHLQYLSMGHESASLGGTRNGVTPQGNASAIDLSIHDQHLADENALKNFDTSRSEADMLLDVDTDTDTDSDNQGGGEHQKNSKKVENTKKKKKTQQEQTLYDWMSKSPASTSAVQSPMRDERQEATDGDVVVGINDDEVMKDSGETPSSKQNNPFVDPLFALSSPVVSVPTSGMQLAEAAEVFSAILSTVGLKKVNTNGDEVDFLTEVTLRAVACVNAVEVTLLTTSLSPGDDASEPQAASPKKQKSLPPVFMLDGLNILLNGTQRPSLTGPNLNDKRVSTDVVLSVSVERVHQHVNFALVRLILQIMETLDVIKEEEKFAAKEKPNEKQQRRNNEMMLRFAAANTNSAVWSPISSPGAALPKCWRNMYNVMNLYTTHPGDVTGPPPRNNAHSRQAGMQSPTSQKDVPEIIRVGKVLFAVTEETFDSFTPTAPTNATATATQNTKPATMAVEQENSSKSKSASAVESQHLIEAVSNIRRTLSVTGTASLKKAQVTASISGLELCFEMRNLNGSLYRNKQPPPSMMMGVSNHNNIGEMSSTNQKSGEAPVNKLFLSVHLDRLKINLVESVKALKDSPSKLDGQPELTISRTLLTCKVYRSHTLHSNFDKTGDQERGHQHTLFSIGPIAVDIPQHPGALRSTVARFSKRLQRHFVEFDDYRASRREDSSTTLPTNTIDVTSMKDSLASISSSASFRVVSNSILISAALLPSLRVEYKIEQINAWGNLSSKARFFCHLPYHVLSFNTKVHVVPLPPTTHIDLPPIKVEGHYLEIHQHPANDYSTSAPPSSNQPRSHGYLSVSVHIGSLEQNLTTDLLNHMIFFQKGFVKEINEVVEVVDNTEQVPLRKPRGPTPPVDDDDHDETGTAQSVVPIIYSIKITLKGIQVTATTPSSTGVRLKTGELTMEVTNQNPSSSVLNMPYNPVKVYGQAKVDINVSLGYFNKSSFSSKENIYSIYANFDTSLGISNLLKEMHEPTLGKETILVTLSKPQFFVMPSAVDKGVLVYLHYKNAYEYWMEQRAVLKTEFPAVALHILNKLPHQANMDELSNYLILQVTVEGLGVCLPIKDVQVQERNTVNSLQTQNSFADTDPGPALLVTAVNASITCCSSGSFVCAGQFKKFCLRLADNFNHMSETWSWNDEDIMNTYTIPEGSYQLCSRTIMPDTPQDAPLQKPGKWMMTLFWKMCGVNIHLDTNIGKRLKLLAKALTALTGDTADVADMSSVAEDFETLKEKTASTTAEQRFFDGVIAQDLIDGNDDHKTESLRRRQKPSTFHRLWEEDSLEKQLLIQTTNVNELRRNGAHPDIIKREVKQLQEIENLLSKEFFKDVKKRFRRKTHRRSTMDTSGSWRRKSFPSKDHRYLQQPSEEAAPLSTAKSSNEGEGKSGQPRSQSFNHHKRHQRSRSLAESITSTTATSTTTAGATETFAGDEIDGPFVESIQYDPSPIIKPIRKQFNLDNYAENAPHTHAAAATAPKPPMQVKFSDSTHDVRSENSDANRSSATVSASEALDFEFNMVIDIESGKCTLHSVGAQDNTDSVSKESEKSRRISEPAESAVRHRPLRSMRSAGVLNQGVGPSSGVGIGNSSGGGVGGPSEHTLLLIPGVKVQLYYISKFTAETAATAGKQGDFDNLSASGGSTNRPLLSKSASLNASVQVESLSKETIVKPSLLDYLEKAFEPIIMKGNDDEATAADASVDNESTIGTGSILSSSGSSLYSFPVDVVVLIRVQPSDIRFSCFPVSKVECLLRIPSLDFAITSTPPNVQLPGGSPGTRKKLVGKPRTSVSTSSYPPSTGWGGSGSITEQPTDLKSGVSFTACLAKFSFCIFHPYGKQYGSGSDSRTGMFSDRRKDSRGSRNQQISGRKESLSLNVEFIKFNFSRNTIKNLDNQKTSVQISAICDIGSAAFNYDMRRLNEILDVPKAWYKRSLMQRLFLGKEGALATKTLLNHSNSKATPTDTSKQSSQSNTDKPNVLPSTPDSTPRLNRANRTPVMTHRRAVSSGTTFLNNLIASPFPGPKSATTPKSDNLHLFDFVTKDSKTTMNDSSSSLSSTTHDMDEIDFGGCNASTVHIVEWETRVIVAINVARVDVSTNMGNIMGQATWSTNDLRTNASVLLNNIGLSSASIDLAVRQGALDAHGGVIGGYIEVSEIAVDGKFVENFGETPLHCANIAMRNGEVRLDYMGSSIVMASLTSFRCKLEDHWLIPESMSEQSSAGSARSNSSLPTSTITNTKGATPSTSASGSESGGSNEFKSCEIYINCDTRWDDLQIIISRSTATDLPKMVTKLQDFLDQQHRSGIRALHTLQSSTSSSQSGFSRIPNVPEESETSLVDNEPTLKYQHWIELMNGLYGLQLNNLPALIPDRNVVLGGRLSLCGNFASLACFHGANFRTQNWGLFTVREPGLQFTSETRVVEKSCQVTRAACVHDVTFFLGKSEKHTITERRKSTVNMYDFMATIRRVSRGRRNPPSFGAPVQEWLIFVNTTSDDEMPRNSSSSPKKEEVGEKYSHTKGQGGSRKVSFAPKFRYENESEVILALPRVHIQLTTEHDQPMTSLISRRLLYNGKRVSKLDFPVAQGVHFVEMSFLSTFDDAIHVTMNATLLFFLHDLILSYMKEQETSLAISSSRHSLRSSVLEHQREESNSSVSSGASGSEPTVIKTEQAIKKEEKYREFRVKNWRLEPRISLLSWAGKRMDPVSIDWVLEKLGFTHANMTIPKWIQRGALDPIDYTLAVVMEHLLVNMKVDQEESG